MAIALGTAVWGVANSASGNYDTSITPSPPGGSILGGVAVGIVQSGSTADLVSGAQYGIGGTVVPLARGPSPFGFATESAEAGGVYWYWAGDSAVFPTGAQTVRITRTGTNRMRAVIWPIYVATGQQVRLDGGATGTHAGAGSANPSWSHASTVNDVVAMLAIHSGNNSMTTTPATNWTRAAGNTTSEDATATGCGWAQRTLATAGALAPGWTDAAAEDWRGSSVAFYEAPPPLALTATGQTTSGGTATLSAGGGPVALAATGSTTSGGAATLSLAAALAASGTTASGGTATLVRRIPLASLVDDFNDGTIDAERWVASGAVLPVESGGVVTFDPDATTAASYPFLTSRDEVDATGPTAMVGEFVMPTGTGTTSLQAGFKLFRGSGSTYGHLQLMRQSGGNLQIQKTSNNVADFTEAVTFSQTDHRWLRIRITASNVIFETSPDGLTWSSPWPTNGTTTLPSWSLAEGVRVGIFAGYFNSTHADPGFMTVDNFNLPPGAVALAAAGTTASQGTATLALAVPLSASGQTASGGTAMLSLAVPLTATGQTSSGGSATLALAVPLQAAGTTVSGGTAALSLAGQVALTASGATTSQGTATLTAGAPLALTTLGTTRSSGSATLTLAGPADAPDAILAATNLTGPVSRLWNQPGSPDSLWLQAANGTLPTDLRVSFPTPATPPGSGGPTKFRVEVRRVAAGDLLTDTYAGTTVLDPRVSLELWEAGVFRATLAASVTVTATDSQVVEGTMDPGVLTDPSGADVQLRVRQVP